MKTLSILFWLFKSKSDDPKNVPIYCRITVGDPNNIKPDQSQISTGFSIDPAKWEYEVIKNGKKRIINEQKVLSKSEEALMINKHLASMSVELTNIFDDLKRKKELISAEIIKKAYMGTGESSYKIIEVYQADVNRKQELANKGEMEQSTVDALQSRINSLKKFIKDHYKVDDIDIKRVDYSFLTHFEHWGKTKAVYSDGSKQVKRKLWIHNTAMDNMKRLKEITDACFKKGWLVADPYLGFNIDYDKPKYKYLEEWEIARIEQKDFGNERLNRIRDIFIFCCYTALSFSDVKLLTEDFLTIDTKGNVCIVKERKKTEEQAFIPLLSKPKAILEKYKNDPECLVTGRLLPVPSNTIYNGYLREIAIICGIKKKLTTHVARHSAATYLLNNNVPEETVAAIMGLASVRELRRTYGKLLKKKLVEDMRNLQKRIDKETGKERRLKKI